MAEKADTTEVLLERELIVYRRERSKVWQCRFKVDGLWQRASTKEEGSVVEATTRTGAIWFGHFSTMSATVAL